MAKIIKGIINGYLKITKDIVHKMKYEGLENISENETYVVVANHVNWADPIYIKALIPNIAVMAKAELFKLPIVKTVIKEAGAFPVDRGAKDIKSVLHATHVLKEGKNLLIFPEGTRNAKKKNVKAKKGAVTIAITAGVKLLPIYLDEKRGLFRKITVKIGEPIEFEKNKDILKDREKLNEYTEIVMDKIYNMRDKND
ncbi:MAG: 1-acyl-sn-glycerol-3-phosphate acyltransferase [Clostridia bacterium]|nr:1-acyl-sn-glycerol-3-phosphate acyltransferase [Clostridia bacterium]